MIAETISTSGGWGAGAASFLHPVSANAAIAKHANAPIRVAFGLRAGVWEKMDRRENLRRVAKFVSFVKSPKFVAELLERHACWVAGTELIRFRVLMPGSASRFRKSEHFVRRKLAILTATRASAGPRAATDASRRRGEGAVVSHKAPDFCETSRRTLARFAAIYAP